MRSIYKWDVFANLAQFSPSGGIRQSSAVICTVHSPAPMCRARCHESAPVASAARHIERCRKDCGENNLLIRFERLPQLFKLTLVLLEHGFVVLNLVLLRLVADLLRTLCELQNSGRLRTDNNDFVPNRKLRENHRAQIKAWQYGGCWLCPNFSDRCEKFDRQKITSQKE